MAEPPHSLDMNEECCNDITTYCQREACTVLLQDKCMETIYLLDRHYHPTYNGTILQVSWHPVNHPLPDHEEHRRCLLSGQCESILCQVQDPTMPHCDPEIIPHICPLSTTSPTPVMAYSTTPNLPQVVSTNAPVQSAERGHMGRYPPVAPPVLQPNIQPQPPVHPGVHVPAPPVSGNFPPPIPHVGSVYPGNTHIGGEHSPGNSPPGPALQPPESVNQPGANPITEQGNPNFPNPPVEQGQANFIPANNANHNDNAGESANSGPANSPENVPPVMPLPPSHEPSHEPNNEPQASNPLPQNPQPGIHRPPPVPQQVSHQSAGSQQGSQPNPLPGLQRPSDHQHANPDSPAVYRSTTESVQSRLNNEGRNKESNANSGSQGNRGEVSTKSPSIKRGKPATEKPDSSRALSEFGAGIQGGFVPGEDPFFTQHRGGNNSMTTGFPEVGTQAGPIGNAPNEWQRLDEKILAGGIVGGALLALLMVCLTVCCVKRRKDGKSSGASTSSSHRGLHLQYSGFPLDSDMLNDPVYKSSVKSANGPPPVPYRPPANHISYAPSFREPANNFVSSGGGVCFGEEQSESNDYEELPCDVDPAAREAYEELVDGPMQPTSRTPSNVSCLSRGPQNKLRSVPTLYDVNRHRLPPVVKRNSSASTLKSNSMRNSMRPLPARPCDSLPRTLEAVPREAYEPLGLVETPHGYEIPVTLGNAANLAMLGILNYPHATSATYDIGTLLSQGNGQSLAIQSDRGSIRNIGQTPQPDYFVLERQDEMNAVPTISGGTYLPESRRQSLIYKTESENSYAEVGHDYLDLERSEGGWQNNQLPSDIHL